MFKKAKGQGTIEYAGALVVAAVIVSAVLALGPTNLGNMFNSVINDTATYFQGEVPTGS